MPGLQPGRWGHGGDMSIITILIIIVLVVLLAGFLGRGRFR